VLGSVNMIWTDAQIRRKRIYNLAYAVSFTLLIASFAAVLVVYKLDIDVLSRLPVL
jgi:hypothetical protein